MAIKILHIITQLELGGAQKNVLSILSSLDPGRYETHLVSSPGLLDEEARGIPHLRLKLLSFLKRQPHLFWDALALLWLFFYIKKEKFQVVHTHSSKAGILGRWAGRWAGADVIIHTVHGWGFREYLRSFWNGLFIFLERRTARITTKLIAVSENDIRKGLDHGIGAPDQYVLIRCGIDPVPFEGAEALGDLRRSLGIGTEDRVVGMVACLKAQKNPVDFVRAAGEVLDKAPKTKFLLVGDGVLKPRVKREVARLGLEDDFFLLGWRKDTGRIMSLLDVCVLTSLWEGLPLALLEAMSAAKPVVAYAVDGVREVVKDGVNGFLVEPRNVSGLALKVATLLEDETLRHRMGKFGTYVVSNEAFSIPYMARQVEDLYRRSLSCGEKCS